MFYGIMRFWNERCSLSPYSAQTVQHHVLQQGKKKKKVFILNDTRFLSEMFESKNLTAI